MGGGLIPNAIRRFPPCPYGVTQTPFPYQKGTPVIFEYPFIGQRTFNTSSIINIRFWPEMWVFCPKFDKLWAVDVSSSDAKEPAIIIAGKHWSWSLDSEFKIEKATRAHTYKLTTAYGTVGTIPSALFDVQKLVVTNDEAKTLIVEFVKVGDITTATTSPVEKLGIRMFPFY